MCLQLSVLRLLVLCRKDCLPDIQMTSIEMDEHAETSQEKPEKFTGVIQWGLGILFWELLYARSHPLKWFQMKIMLQNNCTHWRLINNALQKVSRAKSERDRRGAAGVRLCVPDVPLFRCGFDRVDIWYIHLQCVRSLRISPGEGFFGRWSYFLSGFVYFCCCELILERIVPLSYCTGSAYNCHCSTAKILRETKKHVF